MHAAAPLSAFAFYNENDPYAARWLRNLIAAGHVAPGEVSDVGIEYLIPEDLEGATQAHFFAGIGVWSHALRLAGWPDDLSVWTGSCPCQPFSVAGQRKGVNDARHLWPVWFDLIRAHRPAVIFGEQVASADTLGSAGGKRRKGAEGVVPWFDAVSADLEGAGYTVGAAVLGAHSARAPHVRQRLYFVAHAMHPGWAERRSVPRDGPAAGRGGVGELANANGRQRNRLASGEGGGRNGAEAGRQQGNGQFERGGEAGRAARALADAGHVRGRHGAEPGEPERDAPPGRGAGPGGIRLVDAQRQGREGLGQSGGAGARGGEAGRAEQPPTPSRAGGLAHAAGERRDGEHPLLRQEGGGRGAADLSEAARRGAPGQLANPDGGQPGDDDLQRGGRHLQRPEDALADFWDAADWIPCSDGKLRPVEPGTFPLAHGATARVGRLRAYGNALVSRQAALFVRSAMIALWPEGLP